MAKENHAVTEEKTSKNHKVRDLLIISIIFCGLVGYGYSQAEKVWDESDQTSVTEETTKVDISSRVGEVIQGIGINEIKSEYKEQDGLSEYKGDKYLKSLSGSKIVWVGKIIDVNEYIVGEGNYISLSLSNELFDSDLARIDIINEDYLNLNKGTVIKVSGVINRVDQDLAGLIPLIKDATIEIIDSVICYTDIWQDQPKKTI